MEIPYDIYQYIIFEYFTFIDKISFRKTSKYYHKLVIFDFFNIGDYHRRKLTDEILRNYPSIRQLYASYNPKITNVNHMTNLRILHAYGDNCGIGDDGIKDLNLTELDASWNRQITNVNHMTNLRILDARGDNCGIDDICIKDVILTELHASWDCGIDDNGIKDLNLTELHTSYNPKITNVNHMTHLRILYARGFDCGLSDAGITHIIVNLTELDASGNPKITAKK